MTDRPRHVVLFVFWLATGGMERQTVLLAQGLARRGYRVTVGYCWSHIDTAQLLVEGMEVVDLRARNPVKRVLALPRIARLARRGDVVHCTGWDASLWGRIAAWLARRPVVVTEHSSAGRETQGHGRSSRQLIALHNRLLDRVTYATAAVAEPQVATLVSEGVSRDKVTVIPNGIPIAELQEAAKGGVTRAELGIPEDARVVIQVGRFLKEKRQEWTYRAVREMRADLGDVHVLFAGLGDIRDEMEEQARRDGADWAHFLGYRQDVPALMALSDVAVMPSEAEALPMAMIEAMALGVAQVGTDVGDMGAVLRATGAGIVVGAYDEAGFADGIRTLLSDATRAAEMGGAGIEAVWQFDVEAMVDAYAGLFDAAVARAPIPQRTQA